MSGPRTRGIALALLAVLACSGARAQGAPASKAPDPNSLDRVAWLAGCWAGSDSTRSMEEQWMPPRGGMLLGMGRTIYRGRPTVYEFLRIEVLDGKLVYTAMPGNQGTASFPATQVTDSLVVFANLQHDFPRVIRYRRRPDGSLLARIEGIRGERPRVIEYPMRRVDCESGEKR